MSVIKKVSSLLGKRVVLRYITDDADTIINLTYFSVETIFVHLTEIIHEKGKVTLQLYDPKPKRIELFRVQEIEEFSIHNVIWILSVSDDTIINLTYFKVSGVTETSTHTHSFTLRGNKVTVTKNFITITGTNITTIPLDKLLRIKLH